MKQTTRFLLSLLLTTGLVLSGVSTVWAVVAANTQIINEATLSYGVGADARTATASVTVTVSLVSTVATVTGSGNETAPYTAPNSSVTMQFVVTANSNGPENYSVATSNGTPENTTDTLTSPSVPGDFVLGASITTSGSTDTVIQVPSDGSSNGSINGLEIGDSVVINGEVRTIIAAGFSDPASGTATFTLNAALSSAPGTGVSVFEQKVIAVTAYSGTIQNMGVDIVVPINITVTNGAGTTTMVTQYAIFTSGLATLKKYVRNFSRAAGNSNGLGGQSFTFNGATETFYTGGVTGQTGDVLEYVLLIENTGAAPVPNMRIDDTIPVDYVIVGTGAYNGKDVLHKGEDDTETPLTIVADGDAALLSGAVLTVYIGTGSDPATSTGGSIDAGKSVLVSYRVTIK